jgi:glycosyltransferase involved in cell wall biosynthesis
MVPISVVMSVYNQENFLEKSIESILKQTFKDFELIVINDGSTDRSKDILESIEDPRLIYVDQQNLGLPFSLNKAIGMSQGNFIARMDADDISHSERLEKQFNYLNKNQNIDLVGSCIRVMNEQGEIIGSKSVPLENRIIQESIDYACNVMHPTYFFRKEIHQTVGGYRDQFIYAQDYDFLLRIRDLGKGIGNIEEKLLDYRVYDSSNYSKQFNQIRFSRLAKKLHKERVTSGKENSTTLGEVKILNKISFFDNLVFYLYLNLRKFSDSNSGFLRLLSKFFYYLIAIFSFELRLMLKDDYMYYRILSRKD